MTTDDDMQKPEPDPWAGLDAGGADEVVEESLFSFDISEDHTPSEPEPPYEPEPLGEPELQQESLALPSEPRGHEESSVGDVTNVDMGREDVSADEISLALFPRRESEDEGSEILIGTGRSGILSMVDGGPNVNDDRGGVSSDANIDNLFNEMADEMADELADERADELPDVSDGGFENAFDDQELARELGLADTGDESMAEAPIGAGGDFEDAPAFGDVADGAVAETISFETDETDTMAGSSPFADGDRVDDFPQDFDSGQDDLASIPLTAAVAAAGNAASSNPASRGPVRPVPARKKRGGLGQMIGVVLGGLMALPITYAILIWGFQKDPFKLGRQVPQQLSFLLPQKLRPGYKPPGKAAAAPGLEAAPSLDGLAALAGEGAAPPVSDESSAAATDDSQKPGTEPSTEQKPAMVEAAVAAVEEGGPSIAPAPDKAAAPVAAVMPLASAEPVASVESAEPAVPAADTLPAVDPLPGLDALALLSGADMASQPKPPAAPPVAEIPPLDLTDVDTASEQASEAFEALSAVADETGPDRDRLLVTWYKRLADLGEALVRLETVAAESGRPLSQTPPSAAALFQKICGSDAAVEDLDRLGRMWLTKQKRQADGVALLATLESARQVGPYWSTRAIVSGVNEDGTDRTVAIISRLPPPADVGERVMVSGVLFDGDTVWAAEVRPVDFQQQENSVEE